MEVEEAKLRYADNRRECREKDICIRCNGPATKFRTDVHFLDFLYWSRLCQDCQDNM